MASLVSFRCFDILGYSCQKVVIVFHQLSTTNSETGDQQGVSTPCIWAISRHKVRIFENLAPTNSPPTVKRVMLRGGPGPMREPFLS